MRAGLQTRGDTGFGHDALHFFELVHQVQLRGQAPGGVDQHHVFFARLAGADRVIGHRGRVTAFLADDFYGVALGPDRQLLARSSAKSVGCRQQDAGAAVGQAVGEFANRGGFARTVNARDHDHRGLLRADGQAALQRAEQLGQGLD